MVGVVSLLVSVNILNNLAFPGLYLLWALLGIGCLALLARCDGLQLQQWGLGGLDRRAAVAALALAGLTAAVMLLGARIPGSGAAFADDRVLGMSAGQLAFYAAVRAPVGTAVFEEVAFRGVLLAMLTQRFGRVWGVIGSSAAFGLWHVAPAAGVAAGNEAVASVLGSVPVVAVGVAVVAAGLAGAVLCWLRLRYDHLIVPVAVHATATTLGYVLAWQMLVT